MKTKILLVLSVGLNVTLLGATVYLSKQIPEVNYAEADPVFTSLVGSQAPGVTHDSAPRQIRYGAVIETSLPVLRDGERPEILDFETGHSLREPGIEFFGHNARANVAWIRANGLDISAIALREGGFMCITYYAAAIPIEAQRWDEPFPVELAAHPDLARFQDAKRNVLLHEPGKSNTFLFRTLEGTTGILELLSISPDRRHVSIRYKLLQPAPVSPVADAAL
jgi:hypothetical protein